MAILIWAVQVEYTNEDVISLKYQTDWYYVGGPVHQYQCSAYVCMANRPFDASYEIQQKCEYWIHQFALFLQRFCEC